METRKPPRIYTFEEKCEYYAKRAAAGTECMLRGDMKGVKRLGGIERINYAVDFDVRASWAKDGSYDHLLPIGDKIDRKVYAYCHGKTWTPLAPRTSASTNPARMQAGQRHARRPHGSARYANRGGRGTFGPRSKDYSP